MRKKLSVKDWPESEQPSARAKDKGIEALSDAELLSLILKKCTYEQTEVDVALEILNKAGGLRQLFDLGDLPEAQRIQLQAVREIGRRVLRQGIIGQSFVRSPQAVTDYLSASLRDLKREVFRVMFLDKALKILGDKDIFFGTVDEAAVHPREVVKEALLRNSSNIVLVHNHPSGKIEPSREDYEITQKIKAACQTVSVRVLDHIIVGENQYFSFSERNQL
ncbi:MAG TPA: DNA repair protein RadC [Candidatus Omnitrophota bacterium]|nr:DNA repair protein RadC [Candidatus Omnitrophota bacterium]